MAQARNRAEDLRAAAICATVMNVHRRKGAKAVTAAQLLRSQRPSPLPMRDAAPLFKRLVRETWRRRREAEAKRQAGAQAGAGRRGR